MPRVTKTAAAPEPTTTPVAKLAVPVTAALAAGWAVSQFVYGAGNKVGSSEKDLAYLTSRIDQLEKALATHDASEISQVREDHEAVIELRTKMAGFKEILDSTQSLRDIKSLMDDPKAKKDR